MTKLNSEENYDKFFFQRNILPQSEMIFSLIYRRLHDRNKAAEMTQIVMEKAWKNRGEINRIESLRYWLINMAINELRVYKKPSDPGITDLNLIDAKKIDIKKDSVKKQDERREGESHEEV